MRTSIAVTAPPSRIVRAFYWIACSIDRVLIAYGLLLLIGTVSFALLEGKSFFTGLYWTVTVAMTIGFGDELPTNVPMQSIYIGVAFLGFILNILFVARVVTDLMPNPHLFSDEEQERLLRDAEAARAKLEVVQRQLAQMHRVLVILAADKPEYAPLVADIVAEAQAELADPTTVVADPTRGT